MWLITDSILVDLYPPFWRHWHTWMHTLMHMYTQPHTHALATQKYACTFTHKTPHTHNTMCTQNGVCPLYIASQKGHDRIVEMLLQAGATVDMQSKVENCYYLFMSRLCCAMWIIHCTLSTTQHSGEYEYQKRYPTDNCCWCALEAWVHLVHGLGTCFFNKFGLRMLVWDQNSSEYIL